MINPFVNPVYLKPKILKKVSEAYLSSIPVGVQLKDFFLPQEYREMLSLCNNPRFKKSEVRDLYSFFEDPKSNASPFFKSAEFIRFASKVSGIKLSKSVCSLKVFTPGCYTLASFRPKGKVEFLLDLTPSWRHEWGGSSNYIASDGDRLVLPPVPNSLILASMENIEGYIKYVNHRAKGNGRIMVQGFMS